ncbi:F-box domain containing protein [Tanacetum coccineum]
MYNDNISTHPLYNTNKASLKVAHWVINPKTGTYDVESIRERRPESITSADWDAQIAFWNDPRNQARAAQNRQNRAKSMVVCRQGSQSLARLRDQMMESSTTREYPSLIHTFFVTHTVNGEFTRDEDQAIYSLGKVARESIPVELYPSIYPGRHVARDWYPQRQVAREGVDLSLGIVVNVVVNSSPRDQMTAYRLQVGVHCPRSRVAYHATFSLDPTLQPLCGTA